MFFENKCYSKNMFSILCVGCGFVRKCCCSNPVISPNKTWAGLLGGVIGAAIIGAAVSFFLPNATLLSLVVFGGILAIISQIGDLFESSLKRKYDLKDSGGILPGHGGMLDRLDGMLAVVIAVFLLLIARSFDKGLTADAVLVW